MKNRYWPKQKQQHFVNRDIIAALHYKAFAKNKLCITLNIENRVLILGLTLINMFYVKLGVQNCIKMSTCRNQYVNKITIYIIIIKYYSLSKI